MFVDADVDFNVDEGRIDGLCFDEHEFGVVGK